MATGESRLLKNLDKLGEVLGGQALRDHIDRTIRKAHGKVGLLYERNAKQRIKNRAYAENAPLTKALKGSDLPLVADGDLRGAITHNVVSAAELQMGAISPKVGGGKLLYRILEEGATIRVTSKMRRALMAKLAKVDNQFATEARKAMANFQGKGKAVWIIPPRRFLSSTFEDPRWRAETQRVYRLAMVEITKFIVRKVK